MKRHVESSTSTPIHMRRALACSWSHRCGILVPDLPAQPDDTPGAFQPRDC